MALTVRQPWASLILTGHKTEEYRNRRTFYRGRIAIHSSAALYDSALDTLTADHVSALRSLGIGDRYSLPLGYVLGTVEIVGCERRCTQWGGWGWILERPIIWNVPERAKGNLGLWHMEAGIEAAKTWSASQRTLFTGA